jgi:hypothetical protein
MQQRSEPTESRVLKLLQTPETDPFNEHTGTADEFSLELGK